MLKLDEQLAAIGFGKSRRTVDCGWRSVRLDAAVEARPAAGGNEPACSPALRRWRARLAVRRGPSPYRISRA
ncbi:MAG: hypothetical protein ACM3JG_00335 [Thiohalocapsa sp.]